MSNLLRRDRICGLAGLLACAWLLLLPAAPAQAQAQPLQILSLTQRDLSGDARPDEAVIDVAFATAHDRITVLDQGVNMARSNDWQVATDFRDDVWLYDIGADGDVELIVIYAEQDGHDSAEIYGDVTGDGAVAYRREGASVAITESPSWSARIVSGGRWLLADGRLNLNFSIYVDGAMTTFDRMPEIVRQSWLTHDGKPDAEAESHADADGVGSYVLVRLLDDIPADLGFQRSALLVNSGRYPTARYDRAFFPLLPISISPQDPRSSQLRYFDLPLIISVSWQQGSIDGPLMAGYPIGHGYHLNDNAPIIKGQVNNVAFESPQAYYDLAQNHDRFPELHIRFFTRPGNDRAMWTLPGREAIPWQSISYSWNLFSPGTLRWDYKLGLAGNYVIDEVTSYPDFTLRQVPFDQLPGWVIEREWKLSTFVAREGAGYESAEGIYEWQTDTGEDPESGDTRSEITREATQSYQQGISITPPNAYYTHARVGFRGEYHVTSPQQPSLYFSPVDHRLHLRGAEAGTWNIDDSAELRYANLDGDSYLDQWAYREGGQTRQQLNLLPNYLLYSDGRSVSLKRASVAPALFEMLPPHDPAGWEAQRQRLESLQQGHAGDDLAAMFAQFPGPVWRIDGAHLSDLRADAAGFRFVLAVSADATVTGPPDFQLPALAPGAQVVSYTGGFHVAPLTPPAIVASLATPALSALQVAPVRVQLRNDGLQDVLGATLELWGSAPSGTERLVADQQVALLTGVPVEATFTWVPTEAGTWSLRPRIRAAAGRLITLPATEVRVGPLPEPNPTVIATMSIGPHGARLAALVLLSLALVAFFTVWNQWRAPS